MSCADFTLLPKGGRRSTNSRLPRRTRYVNFEWPLGNCSTETFPDASGKWRSKNGSRRARSSSSPGRTGAGWSCGSCTVLCAPPSAIREHRGIVEMRKGVEGAQCKSVVGENKLTVGTVSRHPGYLERILRRKIQ